MSPPMPNTAPSMASPPDGTRSFHDLIRQLGLYRPPSSVDESAAAASDDVGGDVDVDERGKVFSPVGLPEPAAPHPERFTPKRAAVLICLFEGCSGEIRVILTKRSSNLSTHSGEVALPGGKAEEGDAGDVGTAMREAREEIGLEPAAVTVVSVLEPFLSKHLLRVVPVIGVLSDRQAFQPAPNAAEVETIFDAPLDMFLKDENRRSEEHEWMGEKYLIHFFDFKTESTKFVIWGLTASILIRAASVIYQRPPNFPERAPKFRIPRFVNGNLTMR